MDLDMQEVLSGMKTLKEAERINALAREISPTAEAQWHMIALAYLKALARGYKVFNDTVAYERINKAIYHAEISVHRAFGEKDAKELIANAQKSADEAYIGKGYESKDSC